MPIEVTEEKSGHLYNKYRPKTWDAIVGQDCIPALRRLVVAKREKLTTFGLFGPFGTGKTTTAFVLAKALLCPNMDQTGNPCNRCDSCISIDRRAMGLYYVSCSQAGNGGADMIRRIIEDTQVASDLPGGAKVVILDEIQGLSKAAMDVLMPEVEDTNGALSKKTYYILCSMNGGIARLKPLQSRGLSFSLTPIPDNIIEDQIRQIAAQEGGNLSDEDFRSIVAVANGSLREAITTLDTALAGAPIPKPLGAELFEAVVRNDLHGVYSITRGGMVADVELMLDSLYDRFLKAALYIADLNSGATPIRHHPPMEDVRAMMRGLVSTQAVFDCMAAIIRGLTDYSVTDNSNVAFAVPEVELMSILNTAVPTKGENQRVGRARKRQAPKP